MAKESLAVASSEPVSAEKDTTKGSESKETSESVPKAATTTADKATQKEAKDDDLEDISVDDESDKKQQNDKKSSPVSAKAPLAGTAQATKPSPHPKSDECKAPQAEGKEPPIPTRPLSPSEQIKKDLKDAFPQTEDKYIEAVLIASEGRPGPAFNSLLFLSDPSFKPEPVAPPTLPVKPVRPQYTDDELLARQLQKEFDKQDRKSRNAARSRHAPQPQHEDDSDSPDEFDQLKKDFTQGFEEAKSTINNWVSGISSKFNVDNEKPKNAGGRSQSPKLFGALGGSSFNSTPANRAKKFDDDPEILASDFSRRVDSKETSAPQLPKRAEKKPESNRWQPLNSDVPVSSDAFLVTDSEDDERK